MKISVVICTRNRLEYLERCIASLLQQTRLPDEIVIVDDCSSDELNVFEFFRKEIFQQSLRIKSLIGFETSLVLLKNKHHSGIVLSRNLGIKTAKGDIVAFMDDDSFAHKDWLKNMELSYEDNRRIVGVGGPIVETGRKASFALKRPIRNLSFISAKEGRVVFKYRISRFSDRKFLPVKFVTFLLGGNMSFRRDVLVDIGGCDARYTGNGYHEETDMSFNASSKGKILFNPNVLTFHESAKIGGNREFDFDSFLFYMFRNTAFFFLKHFSLKDSFQLLKNLFIYQVRLLSKGKTGSTRFWLKVTDRKKSFISILMGGIAGVFCWIRTRNEKSKFVSSFPSYIKAYSLMGINNEGIGVLETENRHITSTD